MASLREYFDADFNYATRVHVRLPKSDLNGGEAALLYDFSGHTAFLALYVPGVEQNLKYFEGLINSIQFGNTPVELDGRVTLPSGRAFPGTLEVRNVNPFEIRAQFHGEPGWISSNEIPATSRLFIYSEAQLTDGEVLALKEVAKAGGIQLQFRSVKHADRRSKLETPLAFICHDTRDKNEIAKPIALALQKMLCPVWYDEFSLKVGDNLRTSIEKGLKECKRCVLVLTTNFFTNRGWTRKEFDSIFTREILEERNLILPVWRNVSKQEVYDYSPGLLNVKGIDWQLGQAEVCRQLFLAIMGQDI